MQPIRVMVRAEDASTLAAITAELEAARGREPEGVVLVEDASPRPQGVDPLTVILGVAMLSGVASGAGNKLGEAAMTWLIAKIKGIVKRRKARVSVKVANVEFTVDEATDPESLGREVSRKLDLSELRST